MLTKYNSLLTDPRTRLDTQTKVTCYMLTVVSFSNVERHKVNSCFFFIGKGLTKMPLALFNSRYYSLKLCKHDHFDHQPYLIYVKIILASTMESPKLIMM